MIRRRQALAAALALALTGFLVGWSATGDAPAPRPLGDDIVRFGANAARADPANIVFDETVVRTYDLTLAPEDWDWLNEDPVREQYVPATLRFEGEMIDSVAIRYKGNFGGLRFCFDLAGNLICDKLSIKLKFNEYDPRGRFHGLKRLNFHSMIRDPTKLHDALAYGLFREARVPAPRTAFAWFTVNGEPLGLFAVIENIDDRFTADRFDDGGNGLLYKEVWPVEATAALYQEALQQPQSDADFAPALAFTDDLDAAVTADDTLEVIRARTDYDTLIRLLAVDRLIENWDGIVAWYCVDRTRTDGQVRPGPCFNHNYYWYQDARTGRMTLIPWDVDNSFESPAPIRTFYGMPDWDEFAASCRPIPVFLGIPGRPPTCDPLISALASAGWNDYAAASHRLLDGAYQLDRVQQRIDDLAALIEPFIALDPSGPALGEWRYAVAALRSSIEDLRRHVADKLDARPPG